MKSRSTQELVAELRLFNHHEAAARLEKLDDAILTATIAGNNENNDKQAVLDKLARALILPGKGK